MSSLQCYIISAHKCPAIIWINPHVNISLESDETSLEIVMSVQMHPECMVMAFILFS